MRSTLLIFLIILTCKQGFANSVQLGTGGITPHFSSQKKNYCNQWNNSGVIVNKTYYASFYWDSWGLTYMEGNDSICSPIQGYFIHYILNRFDIGDVGIVIGGYSFNADNWQDHADNTPSGIASPEPVRVKVWGKDVVPVLALEANLYLIRGENWGLKLNNLFTVIIFNHSLAYEYRF